MRPTVTEQTAKRWKLIQVLGVLTILVGAVFFFLGMMDSIAIEEITDTAAKEKLSETAIAEAGKGMGIGFLGLIVWLIGRVGGWWFHG